MILTDKSILAQMEAGNIKIEPFDPKCLGTNSYDVHLGTHFAKYVSPVLDFRVHNKIQHTEVQMGDGIMLLPGELYLASTLEYTETLAHVPFLEGKSSVGRLGTNVHITAGKGDVGFCNYWTLEITAARPAVVYAGMPIGQLIYFCVEGEIENIYTQKANAKYNERDPKPKESMMWKNFDGAGNGKIVVL